MAAARSPPASDPQNKAAKAERLLEVPIGLPRNGEQLDQLSRHSPGCGTDLLSAIQANSIRGHDSHNADVADTAQVTDSMRADPPAMAN